MKVIRQTYIKNGVAKNSEIIGNYSIIKGLIPQIPQLQALVYFASLG
jgi:hypothetical protein